MFISYYLFHILLSNKKGKGGSRYYRTALKTLAFTPSVSG
jgi:hypothetical protein